MYLDRTAPTAAPAAARLTAAPALRLRWVPTVRDGRKVVAAEWLVR
ncbi:MAG: hypothetical protein AAFY28_14105 [Actinomycetota bacterium]